NNPVPVSQRETQDNHAGRRSDRMNSGSSPLLRRAAPAAAVAALVVVCMALGFVWSRRHPPAPADGPGPPEPPAVAFGASVNAPRAFQGYTLIAPMKSAKTYLIDMQGRVVRSWESDGPPGLGAYLLENGHLLRTGILDGVPGSEGPGAAGRVQEFTWDGDLVWDFQYHDDNHLPHHDITRLPNGNVVLIVWEKKTKRQVLDAGRRPDWVGPYFLLDCLIQVRPTGKTTGDVVWEWHLWDHLVQDHDKSKA